MGSYDYTCGVSNLPISCGTDVRVLLLSKNPYDLMGSSACEMHSLWVPRTFPIKGKYDDYGNIACLIS